LGDDTPCKIVGIIKAQIKKNNGNQWLLKEVRDVLAKYLNRCEDKSQNNQES
jgi:hypothetical protein